MALGELSMKSCSEHQENHPNCLTVESFVKFKLALLGQVQGLAKLLNQMKI